MTGGIGPTQGMVLQALFGQRLDLGEVLNPDGTAKAEGAQGALALSAEDQAKLDAALLNFKKEYGEFVDSMKDHPALPPVAREFFEGLSGEELMMAATAINDQAMEKVSKVTAQSIIAVKDKLAAANKEKLDKIMEKIKAEKDAEPGFWGKLFGWVSKIVTAVVSVVAMVAGAALVATGAGAAFGVALFALGAYMAAGVTVDVINEVRKSQGKEPLDWSPTLGQLAKVIAMEVFNADEETANWIKTGLDIVTDIVVGVAVSIMLPGAGMAVMAKRAGDALKFGKAIAAGMGKIQDGVKLSSAAVKFQKGAAMASKGEGVVSATASIGKGVTDIVVAVDQKAATVASAEVKEMVAKLLKFQTALDELSSIIKDIEEKRSSGLKRCSDTVAQFGETTAQITANVTSMA